MRISGQGGGGAQTPGEGRDRSDPEAFRRGRRPGQIVRGRLVAPGPDGLYWVVVAGHKLLASLDHEPVAGRELVFRIERLEPDLVLKDITPPPTAGTDPALLLAALTEARSRFERRLSRFFPPAPPPLDLTAARRAFAAFLAADPAAREDFAAARRLMAQTRAFLPRNAGTAHYVPWMFPGLTQSELFSVRLRPQDGGPGWSLRACGRLEEAGLVAAIVSVRPGQVLYRLLCDNRAEAEALLPGLGAVRFGRATHAPACQGVGPLPAELASGFLARLLAATARPFTGLRLRV